MNLVAIAGSPASPDCGCSGLASMGAYASYPMGADAVPAQTTAQRVMPVVVIVGIVGLAFWAIWQMQGAEL